MFDEIRKYFKAIDEPAKPLEAVEKAKLAAAAVLVAAARADGVFGAEEIGATLEGLEKYLNIDSSHARKVFDLASDAFQNTPLSKFVETLKAEMNDQEREAVLSIVWAVFGADGMITEDETAFAVELRQSLGLSLEQSLRARKAAEHVTEDGFHEFVERSAEVVAATLERERKLGR